VATDLSYDVTGAGPPVVLLHEGVVDSRIWAPVVPLLAEHHRVISYDQRGFGRSPAATAPYSVVDDLIAVLDTTEVERAALVGASRGGNIALTAALDRPERVAALVLVGTGLPGHRLHVEWTPEQIARWDEAEATDDYEAMAELDLEVWAPLGADDELKAMFLENAVGSNSDVETTDQPVADRVGRIAVPTLIVTGARDVPAINEIGELLARELQYARHVELEDADHMLPWRTPKELADLVLGFLAENGRSAR
jgi:3-oxoadipate enol-lactonase